MWNKVNSETIENKITKRINTVKSFKCLGIVWMFIWPWEETQKHAWLIMYGVEKIIINICRIKLVERTVKKIK